MMRKLGPIALVASGLLLGLVLMQRPWASEAEAANRVNNKITDCIGFDNNVAPNSQAELSLTNVGTQSGTGDALVTLRWFRASGSTDSTRNFTVGQNRTRYETNDNEDVTRAQIASNLSSLVVDGRMNWNKEDPAIHRTQTLCVTGGGGGPLK